MVGVLVEELLVLVGIAAVVLGLVVQGLVTLEADGSEVLLHHEEVLGHVVVHGLNHVLLGGFTLDGVHLGTGFHVIDDGVGVQTAGHVHIAGHGVVEGVLLHAGQGFGLLHVLEFIPVLFLVRATPGGIHLEGGVHHVFFHQTVFTLVDVHVLAGAGVPFGTVEATLQLSDLHGRTVGVTGKLGAGNGVVVDGVLLESLGPGIGGKLSVLVLPAVQGLVLAHRLHIVCVEVVQGHAHAVDALAAQGAHVKDYLHLFAPAFAGQAGVTHGNGFDVVVHHHVVVVQDGLAVYTHLRESRPAVVKHHHAAGVIHGIVTVGGHIGLGLRKDTVVQVYHLYVFGNLGSLFGSLGAVGQGLLQLIAVGNEVGIGIYHRVSVVIPAAAAARAAPRHAVRAAVSAAGAVFVLDALDHVILNFIGIVQHITFTHYSGIGELIAERMVVLGIVDHHIGRIGRNLCGVPLIDRFILPGIFPCDLNITGLTKLTGGNLVQRKIINQDDLIIVRSLGGGVLQLVINVHRGGILALEEQRYHAKRLGVLTVGRGLDLGGHGLFHGGLLAVGIPVLNVHGVGSGGNRQVDGSVIAGRDGFGKHIRIIRLGLFLGAGNRIQHAGHGHHGHGPCEK